MGVSHLLDTHVLLWLVGDPSRVPAPVRSVLADPGTPVFVSAVSAMEIATKTRLGKLPDVGLLAGWHARLAEMSLDELPLSAAAALHAGGMDWQHRDPFDRMLLAQAIEHNLTLVTVDHVFANLPAPRVLSW